LPDLTVLPLPEYHTFAEDGFHYAGRQSPGNNDLRNETIPGIGYAIPCHEAIETCVGLSPLVEVGAGLGFWAHLIERSGGDIVATDLYPRTVLEPASGEAEPSLQEMDSDHPCDTARIGTERSWHRVRPMDAADAVRAYPDRTVLMIWPSLGRSWPEEVLDAMVPGQCLIHVGQPGEATDTERFAERIRGEEFEEIGYVVIPTWPGQADGMTILRRRYSPPSA
jgi:hypothetical protein